MTVSSALPPLGSDSLFTSENSTPRSPNPYRSPWFQKLATLYQSIVNQTRSWLPALSLCAALCGMSCASIFVVIVEQELSPMATVFNRLLIATIAFSIWNMLQSSETGCPETAHQADPNVLIETSPTTAIPVETTQKPTPCDIGLLILAGICFAASLSLAAWSLTQTSVANSALLNNMMPIFTTVGAWLFLAQRFSRKFLLGLLVAIGGVFIIGIQDFHLTNSQISGEAISGNHMVGDAAALLAAVLLAVTILSLEQLRAKFSTAALMMGVSLTGSLVIFPILLCSQSPLFPTSWASGLAVLGLALIAQVLGHGLLTYSLKQFSSGLVAVAMLAIPMIATLLAMILFAQPLSLLNGIAFSIVLIGIYLAVSAPKCSQDFSS